MLRKLTIISTFIISLANAQDIQLNEFLGEYILSEEISMKGKFPSCPEQISITKYNDDAGKTNISLWNEEMNQPESHIILFNFKEKHGTFINSLEITGYHKTYIEKNKLIYNGKYIAMAFPFPVIIQNVSITMLDAETIELDDSRRVGIFGSDHAVCRYKISDEE